ncbi:MAG: HAD-IB family hydrolase [Actinomycetota bacterium]|nr:HAD-IB family hydrolase [Actinomycetota bacterium]
MAGSAAIFDLDRTLLDGGSWPVIDRALRDTGVLPDRDIPLLAPLVGLFRAVGETALTMQLTRRASRAVKGWSVGSVREAAIAAADPLIAELQPYVPGLLAMHRDAGQQLVLATTTPEAFVAPFAERLGFDAVVATRYREVDGRFDGTIDGDFVWNRGKKKAVVAWAEEHGVSMRRSYAYSDSFYDAPLLAAVGHPTAVNPDPRLFALAQLKGWPIRHLDKPDGVLKVVGRELQELMRPFLHPALIPNARIHIDGVEHIPTEGPAILCANHRSYFDPTVLLLAAARRGRNARFLGKREVFEAPIVGTVVRAFGGISVDRGSGADTPLLEAARALEAGELVALMPQGTIPRGEEFFDRVLRGRWGAVRLARMTGAPIVPVGLWGTERVWPRNARLPNLDVLDPPEVTACVGEPYTVEIDDVADATVDLMERIVALLPEEAGEPFVPTAEDLARTYPPGHASGNGEVAGAHAGS